MAVQHGFAEQYPRRLVVDADIDADLLPLALQHLLDQLARTVARGCRQLDGQALAVGVLACSVRLLQPTCRFEQLRRPRRVVAMSQQVVGEAGILRFDKTVGDRLTPGEKGFHHRLTVEAQEQPLAHPAVGKRRHIEIAVDMLEGQPRLVGRY